MSVIEILKNQDGVNQDVFEANIFKHMGALSVIDPEELIEVISILNEKGISIVKESGIINYALASCTKEEALQIPAMVYSDEISQGRVA